MTFETPLSTTQSVRPIHDADRGRPDGQSKRDGKKQQQQGDRHEDPCPIPNDRGQITGKLIDVIA